MRRFTSQNVAPETVETLLEAGRYTPSGSNIQPVSYVVVRENIAAFERTALAPLRRAKRLADVFSPGLRDVEIDDSFFFKGAPVVLVVKSSSVVDGALAAATIELAAQSLGLGVLYSGLFTRMAGLSRRLKKMLALARGEKVVTTLVLGYPAVQYKRTAQKDKPPVLYV